MSDGSSRMTVARSARTFVAWWILGFALWLLLEDLATLPESIDGAVAATIGAFAATAAVRSGPRLRAPRGWAARAWRPLWSLVADLPALIVVLARALLAGERDPGRLRAVRFAPAADAEVRAGQSALATIAGSLAPGAVVVAVDADGERLVVHELRPRHDRRAADPLELG